jgi:hypothetical protein
MHKHLLCVPVLLALAAVPVSADPCVINFASHGTFRVVSTPEGSCLQFVDALGAPWDVANPRGAWTDGLSGTILAEFLAPGTGSCPQLGLDPLRICTFDSDVTRNIVGRLDFLTPAETNCPGWYIRVNGPPTLYRLINCADFGTDLCDFPNEGRHVQATAFVDNGITNCISPATSVFSFKFLD